MFVSEFLSLSNLKKKQKNVPNYRFQTLCSLFGFVVLHMLMYAANIYFWRRYRVNHSFIFGFKQGTDLGYNEVLLLSFVLAALALTSVLVNLDMQIDPVTKDYKLFTELLPLILVLVRLLHYHIKFVIEFFFLKLRSEFIFTLQIVIAILLCPLNIVYRSSRVFFLTCVFHCICAPLYKVKKNSGAKIIY